MRELRCSIELRADDSRQSPGRLVGSLMVYGEKARSRSEIFSDGALTWPADGVVLNESHNQKAPILRFVPILEGRKVRIDAALPDTQRGRDVATGMRSTPPLYKGLSVEFVTEDEGFEGGLRIVKRARLIGAGLVDHGDYGGDVEVRHGQAKRRARWV